GLGEHRLGGRRREAGGERQLDELAARDLPAAHQLLGQLQFLHALRHRNFPPSSLGKNGPAPLPCAGGWIFFVEAKPAVYPHQLVGPPCVSVLVCFRCVAPDLARSADVSGYALTDPWVRQRIPTIFLDRFLTYSDGLKSRCVVPPLVRLVFCSRRETGRSVSFSGLFPAQ